MKDIGVVGLGPMGLALTEQLVAQGHSVSGFDIAPAALATAAMHGAAPAASARQVAEESDLVLTALPGPDAVRDVVFDPDDGLLAGFREGSMLCDMTTAGPDLATELGEALGKVGASFVDAPVSGKAPRMTVLVGGEPGVLGGNEGVFEEVSTHLVYCGRLGAGYATKLVNQHVKYGAHLVASEALLVAQSFGLDAEAVADAVELCSGGRAALPHAAEYFRGDERAMRAHAPASTIEKDLLLAAAMTSTAGVESPTLAAAADFFVAVGETPYRELPYPASTALLADLRRRASRRS